jgi:hypothetical protein
MSSPLSAIPAANPLFELVKQPPEEPAPGLLHRGGITGLAPLDNPD